VRNSQFAVDYVHLKAQAADDLDVMREVLQLFIVHTEQVLEGLEAAGDARTWKELTHTLKGSARGVGAFAVADAAAIAETATLDKGQIAAIREAFEAARQFVAANPV
jgi:HPt (histidine-containing phosphotransfer) domain-containing protein